MNSDSSVNRDCWCDKCERQCKEDVACKVCRKTFHPSCLPKHMKQYHRSELNNESNITSISLPNAEMQSPENAQGLSLPTNMNDMLEYIKIVIQSEVGVLLQETRFLRAEVAELRAENKKLTCVINNFTEISNGADLSLKLPVEPNGLRTHAPLPFGTGEISKNMERGVAEDSNVQHIKQCENNHASLSLSISEPLPVNQGSNQVDSMDNGDILPEVISKDQWQSVNRRKRQRKRPQVVGTASVSIDAPLRAASPRVHLHVYKLHHSTTVDEVKAHLATLGVSHSEIVKLESRRAEDYASFRVSVAADQKDTVNDSAVWPRGTAIRRFFFRPQKPSSPT